MIRNNTEIMARLHRNVRLFEEYQYKKHFANFSMTKEISIATETPIERSEKQQQKHHTIKTQLIIEENTGKILSIYVTNGSKHDYQLCKEVGINVGDGSINDYSFDIFILHNIYFFWQRKFSRFYQSIFNIFYIAKTSRFRDFI